MDHPLQNHGAKWDLPGARRGVRALHHAGALKLLSSSAEFDNTVVYSSMRRRTIVARCLCSWNRATRLREEQEEENQELI